MDWKDLLPPLILMLSVGVVGWLGWFCVISEFPDASPWRRGRERFLDLAEQLGFVVSRESCIATKQVTELSLTAGIKVVRHKSNSILMYGHVPLPDVPSGLSVALDTSTWAFTRAFGAKERSVGDPEFDAVFWTLCDDEEQVRSYLTPQRRQALLHWIPQVPSARIADGALRAEVNFNTPSRMRQTTFEPFLSGLEGLASSLQSESVTEGEQIGHSAVSFIQRKFARRTTFVWSFLLLLSLVVDSFDVVTNLVRASTAIMVLLSAGLYRGFQGCRVLLQGIYAFLGLASGGILVVGLIEAAELLPWRFLRLKEDEIVVFVIVDFVIIFWFWGCRHHLKALDTTKARSRGV